MSPVVPHFPYPQVFRGHYSEKWGTGPELLNNARRERMRSKIAMLRRPKAGGNVIWDAGAPAGGYSSIYLGMQQEKRNSTEQKNRLNCSEENLSEQKW
jgi:hypothetical protein